MLFYALYMLKKSLDVNYVIVGSIFYLNKNILLLNLEFFTPMQFLKAVLDSHSP
jgi:hypothetical protein